LPALESSEELTSDLLKKPAAVPVFGCRLSYKGFQFLQIGIAEFLEYGWDVVRETREG
jgi:hypothetical protein